MIRLAVRVRREQAEMVLAELLELAPAGVEEVQVSEQTIEYAVYGSPGELPSLPDLNAIAGDALLEISTSHTPDDWAERWKLFHRPVLIESPLSNGGRPAGPAIRVRPPWEPPGIDPAGPPVLEIVIDPGQAFGTGGHASTRLCLELMLALGLHGPHAGPLLDIGTGSGVLAIAASRLGYAPVLALDHDRASVTAARENGLANGVQIDVRRLDLRSDPLPPAGPAPGSGVVVANLLKSLLIDLAAAISDPPGHLIAGGLLVGEVDRTVAAFGRGLGMHERERRVSGEWAAVWLTAGDA